MVEHNSNSMLPDATASYNYEAMGGIDVLTAAGRVLYGDRWHTPLARDLGTTYRTVRHWLDGRHPTPAGLEERLRRLLTERGCEIEAVVDAIDTDTDAKERPKS